MTGEAQERYYECANCGRAENADRIQRETWNTVFVFEEDQWGGRPLAQDVRVCGRVACWNAVMRRIRSGQFREDR